MKIVINKRYGGFGISDEACEWLMKNKNWKLTDFDKEGDYIDPKADFVRTSEDSKVYGKYWLVKDRDSDIRTNPDLVECVETLGEEANGGCSELKIVEIPDGIEWEIDEYDGMESVHEVHRSWN